MDSMARRHSLLPEPPAAAPVVAAACPLCGRPLGGVNIDRHHLIPKSLKGREQFAIHKICHRKIHATFSERELLHAYHTWDALQGHDEMRAFIAWVAKRPPEFYTRTFTSKNKKGVR